MTKLIIFDMDGVITSESSYWDAAALTVYQQIQAKELFESHIFPPEKRFFDKTYEKIRKFMIKF